MTYKSGRSAAGPTMTVLHAILKFRITLPLLLFLSWGWAQSTEDGIAAIVSALQNQEYQKALELLPPALKASPRDSRLWAMQGAAYAGEGHKPEALVSFEKALKISPDYLPALEGTIQIEYEAGDPAAIPHLQHVLRLRPADATSHGMLAVLEYQQGSCAAAAIQFEKAGALFDS